jgi:hypothetical protein
LYVIKEIPGGLANETQKPDEHKFAVYTPLFAPIAVPMVIGLLKELLGWWRRRKARMGKMKTGGQKVVGEAAEFNSSTPPAGLAVDGEDVSHPRIPISGGVTIDHGDDESEKENFSPWEEGGLSHNLRSRVRNLNDR